MVKNYAKTMSYIFEGAVIKQGYSPGKVAIFNIMKITKIYKGSPQLKVGDIKVVSWGPGDDVPPGLSNGGEYIVFGKTADSKKFDNPAITTDNINSLTVDCLDFIDLSGNKYIDVLNYRDLKQKDYDSLTKHSTITRDIHDSDFFIVYDSVTKRSYGIKRIRRYAAQWSAGKFPTIDSLYSFLKEGGLSVQEEVDETKQK